MTYNLSANLFVEHGAAALARQARSSAREYKLLKQFACDCETRSLDQAA